MIARDNGTRELLNRCARDLLIRDGKLDRIALTAGGRDFRLGDRVIARRNDRRHDIDNGTLGRITDVNRHTGAITIISDAGHPRTLAAGYVTEHLEHAYTLTAHGAQGATFEWTGVIGRASEFTREWAYTALTRARDRTRVYLITEATADQLEREQYAPPEPERTPTDVMQLIGRSMLRREAEALALERVAGAATVDAPTKQGAPAIQTHAGPTEPNWRSVHEQRGTERGLER
jgi:hypothetical protein